MTQIMPRVPLYLLINAGEWADDTPEGEEPKTKKGMGGTQKNPKEKPEPDEM
ncbi:MAG: hypothetical protein PHH16_01655 [Candidatus Gracilibacteria bacterium]|nr:hypothetical protein [Candidatus Gracilibacteria bacterium]